MFVYPLRQMGRIVADLGKATVALGRLREVLDTPVEPAGGDVVNIAGRVEFQSVSFGYADGTKALSDVSFVVPARSTTAFVGASGSGKSTLIALLLRFYDPDSGTIRIDGADHLGLDRHRLREQVAVVMQQPFLFSKTLEQNLKLGWAGAQIDDVVAATATAQVHDTITGMEDGYATSVGERGVTLSGGQRQRLALARALLQRSGVLILDDALSAVDTRTEAAILAGLAGRRGRQTTILVAHRLSTVVLADEIHVLDAGSIVQSGTHEELVRADGPYARMWALQTEDNHATRVSA
jgi:ATP-binding cassette subfamily B protein